jgi:hypothetical protein
MLTQIIYKELAMKQKNPKHYVKRQDFWKDHIRSWEISKLSQSDYCKGNNLDINLFSKWKHRLLSNNFVEIDSKEVSFPKNEYPIEILINNKYSIKLVQDFPLDDLKKIISVIGGDI